MGESNKTPKAQPQIRSHEIISVYNCGGDADYSFSDQLEKRQEEYEKVYRALIKDNGYHISGDYDEWFEAYCTMNEMEINRESAYEKAKLNKTLLQCRESLRGSVGVEITAAGGLEIAMGDSGRDWLIDKINAYFESDKWIIPYYPIYCKADYEDTEEGKSRYVEEEERFKLFMDEQEVFIREYEKLKGDKRGLYAKHLGWYVNYFMERVPAWAASLTENEKYRFIGDMLERAGVVERYKGPRWTKNTWMRMDKKRRADQVRQWMMQASKE